MHINNYDQIFLKQKCALHFNQAHACTCALHLGSRRPLCLSAPGAFMVLPTYRERERAREREIYFKYQKLDLSR